METELIQRMSNDDMNNKTLIVRRTAPYCQLTKPLFTCFLKLGLFSQFTNVTESVFGKRRPGRTDHADKVTRGLPRGQRVIATFERLNPSRCCPDKRCRASMGDGSDTIE